MPTVNLVNINISRIMERASEIGVRKAFGAPARTLVGQFLVENVLLTLVGGADRASRCRCSCCACIQPERHRSLRALHAQPARLRLRRAAGARVRARLRRLSGVADVPPQPRRRAQGRRRRDDPAPAPPDLEPQAPELSADGRDLLLVPGAVRRRAVRRALREQRAAAARLRHRSRLEHHRRPQGAGQGSGRARRGIARRTGSCSSRCARCRRSRSWPARFTGPYANSNWGSGVRLHRRAPSRLRREQRSPTTSRRCFRCRSWPAAGSRARTTPRRGSRWSSTARLAREIFGDADPVGQIIPEERDPNEPPPDPNDKPEVKRVVGVIDDFRQNGELVDRRELSCSSGCASTTPSPKAALPERLLRAAQARDAGGLRGDAGEACHGGRARLVVRGAAARCHARGQAAAVHHAAHASSAPSPRSCC